MKTWEDPMEDENGTILNRYIITECESVDDVLSLDATVEGQRLQRALTAPHISDIDEWLWDLEDNQDPDALRPDEVVFLDDEHTWYHVKGSGLCLANGCSAEYWLPYMFTDENRWETFYLDRDHSKLFHSGMPRLWTMNPSAFMPCNDWQEGYTVANPERPASVYGQQDPFIQGRTPDDALIFHQGDSASPEDCCRDDSVSVSLAQYQKNIARVRAVRSGGATLPPQEQHGCRMDGHGTRQGGMMSARNKPDNLEQPVVYKCEDCSKPTHTCACGHCHNHIWRCLRCGRKLCAECDFTFDGLCGECYRKPEQELTYRQLAFDSYHANHRLLRNLIEIRERHGISQAELAERMNIPVQTIIGIENGSLEFLPYLTDYALEVGALVEYKITPYDITITEGERE